MAKNSAMQMMKDIQQMNSDLQIKLQEMTDKSSAQSFEYNAQEAEKARNWQTEMSNTSHQREVADLKAAGLNPVLSSGGSGAAGYTTSAASASADNAANAVASAYGSSINAISGIKSAQISSAANLKAAKASAAAMRDAAYAQASASKYASDMHYKATELAWKKKQEIVEYQISHTPASNKYSLVDKYLSQSGISGGIASFIKKQIGNMVHNPTEYFKSLGKNSRGLFNSVKLTKTGKKSIDGMITSIGLPANSYTRLQFMNAYVNGNKQAIKNISDMMKSSKKQTYSTYNWSTRGFH